MPPKRGSPQKKTLALRTEVGEKQPTIASTNADASETEPEVLVSDSHESVNGGTGKEGPGGEETQVEKQYRKLNNGIKNG